MFQTAELGQKLSRKDFDEQATSLRLDLLNLQQELRKADFPVIILFSGVDGAGKGESVNLLNEWMDPHWIRNQAYDKQSDEEKERPHFWRFWRDLPPKGQIGLFLSAWYSQPLLDHVHQRINSDEFEYKLNRIAAFEKNLVDDGALILKFWMHLSKDAQKRRFKSLESDPLTSWRVSKNDWENWKRYDNFITSAARAISRTSTGQAQWTIVEGEDSRYRSMMVLNMLRDSLTRHLKIREQVKKTIIATDTITETGQQKTKVKALTILDKIDLTKEIPKNTYVKQLRSIRAEIAPLARQAKEKGVSTLLVFEGWDAAGKGGAIRRLTSCLEARDYQVHPFSAPTDEERGQHYLWRFWRHLPRAGKVAIFDRSWYGRVLVERVEGFAPTEVWQRAYQEINDFEEQLVHHGLVLIKFWLHISKEEQEIRFKERQEIAYKRWKLTDEDWRNRTKWDDYVNAVNDMVEKTSTSHSKWDLIPANNKNFARIKVLQIVAERMQKRLGSTVS